MQCGRDLRYHFESHERREDEHHDPLAALQEILQETRKSYYIDFRNKRPAYLTNFLDNLVNWENVASRM